MRGAVWTAGAAGLFLGPGQALAAGADPVDISPFAVIPFVAMLLSIALLPLFASRFWHSNFRKLLVSFLLSVPVVVYFYFYEQATGQAALHTLEHASLEYLDFIVLLAALYTVSGG